MFSKNRKLKFQDPNCNLNKWTDRRKKIARLGLGLSWPTHVQATCQPAVGIA